MLCFREIGPYKRPRYAVMKNEEPLQNHLVRFYKMLVLTDMMLMQTENTCYDNPVKNL